MKALPALAVDVLCILVFAIVGRSSHGEANDLIGVAQTAWPFLAGALIGHAGGRVWRRPAALASGVFVWASTVLLGMLLRALSGGGVELSFVIVATIFLGLFLVGWRVTLRLIRLARHRSQTAQTP